MISDLMRLFGWGKIGTIKDDGNAQNAQVQLSVAQTRDNSPMLGLHGVISNAPDGSDAVWLAHAGDASKVIVIGTNHQPSRFKNAPRGAGGSYDQCGSYLLFSNDGNATLVCSGTLTIKTGTGTHVLSASGITTTGEVTRGYGTAKPNTLGGHGHPSVPAIGAAAPPIPGT